MTDAVLLGRLRELSTRFVAVTLAGASDRLRRDGDSKFFEADGERRARIALTARDERGEVKLAGEAVVAV